MCPYSSFKKYLSVLNNDCDLFFQRPKSKLPANASTWFDVIAVGKNTLSDKMKTMSLKKKLSKVYTNHCLRATSINLLDSFEARHVMAVSGHKSGSSIRSYARTSGDQKQKMPLTLAEALSGSGQPVQSEDFHEGITKDENIENQETVSLHEGILPVAEGRTAIGKLVDKIDELITQLKDSNPKNDALSRAIRVASSPLLSPMPVSELEVDGWEMVFRAQSGNGQSVYDAWRDGTGVTVVKPTAVGRSYASHYRDPRVAEWNSLQIRHIKFSLFYENREVAFIIFDGTGSDHINWFDKTRVVSSSYSDLTSTGTYNFFSFVGHERADFHYRRFFVNKSYAGCPGDFGWLDVADIGTVGPCDMDKHAAVPQFLYSSINAADQWERGRYGRADYMAIFIHTIM